MSQYTNYIGKPTSRVDGPAKVTGAAKYSAEFNVPNLTYGVVVSSPIAKGRIIKVHSKPVLKIPGVLAVFSHENVPNLAWFDRNYKDDVAPGGSPFRPLHDNEIKFNQQPIALVVADTFEVARYAASILEIEYEEEDHETDIELKRREGFMPGSGKTGFMPPPPPRGKPDKEWKKAAHRIEHEYVHGAQHHNPMELFATTTEYHADGTITAYDKTQGVYNCQQYISKIFGLSKKEARVINHFMGGGFGSGLRPQYQLFMSVLAALELKRSVRVTLTRQQMFSFGHRPHTLQYLKLGTNPDGSLAAVQHHALHETSRFEEYTENVVNWSGMLYQCDNVKLGYQLAELDVYTPLDMRAPGAATGSFALEVAMDEMAYEAGLDPLDFRIRNYAEKDQNMGKPFSSKKLRDCYHQGAAKFGWDRRNPRPRSMREGNMLVGWGMAGGVWDASQQKAAAKAVLTADGHLKVTSAAGENGTGTYTIMTQIAAEYLGLPIEAVTFKLGDTDMPEAPVQGGSWTAASVGTAVKSVCEAIGEKLFKLAQKMKGSPLKKAKFEDVEFVNGQIRLRHDPNQSVVIKDVLQASGKEQLEANTSAMPNYLKQMPYSMHSHNAVFAEVKVDEDLGTVHVTRVVNAVAAGRILNAKTARSQVLGSVVWGISMALMEETVMDHKFGRYMNHNYAEYHIPVNADIHDIDVIFVEEEDDIVNPLGVKGIGEVGLLGVAAAITNAVFHATGKRVRTLPVMLDKLL
ncbi:xanthine dehydrogenase family protein molybdopterin-binding subunit [Hymenobacter taeanensis]|uniref:Xanthine dehydrogenase family protein molybdopterin-binding subunit n=1 Tax=Hymenobacter taeanensis TaxID=2735321 RepID=A0A6M6BPT3_9BACT|nr:MULTISPECIES: xanthine dehydrogenase family protein molybdopterin-binding subunit [Hymenobacter]QJX48985.1 xanthine dehydrogenase family protein molybdopterin-binding subunit [Hymenobacter taeanensis]UOQ81497.1 xanthine dehydrogenase family protein molybdopterin-binding subunit [Hymenobacter sp. 5414T-23]